MDLQLRPNHRAILNKYVEACQSDECILAALMVGSYVKGRADEHSDLDLFLIMKDDAFDDFVVRRDSLVRWLGEPAFREDFGLPDILFLIFPDGSEAEIAYVRESQRREFFNEPYRVLLDRENITTGVIAG